MLVYRSLGVFTLPFRVENYRVIEDRMEQGASVSQASVKLHVGEELSHQVAEGDGPVNALDAALRKALVPYYPYMKNVRLDDFKVRVLGSNVGSDAHVRVWTTFGDERIPGMSQAFPQTSSKRPGLRLSMDFRIKFTRNP